MGRVQRYNELAGTSLERIAGISDGIFSVAMTLLVLGLVVPASDAIHSESDLIRALWTLRSNALI